ncbi:MAG: hypothetical protein V4723_07560 [Pseudomonadota bacterium]
MKTIFLCVLLGFPTLALQGCTDKDREIAARKSNGLDTFVPGKAPTNEEIEARAKKRRAESAAANARK